MRAQEVIHNNFVDYAEDAVPNDLPSCIDGLLPVHRKIIYALDEAGINSNKPYKKMLMCSSEVMKYYIFGDIPLTDTMKNSGSNFLLYKYLDPKGAYPDKNRRDGKGASPRYIECRLSEYSEYMLNGIKYKNVPFVPNWDNSREEPVYLPSPVPNCLINYSESISVGFASKIPSHNLNEVCDCFINYITTGNVEDSMMMIKGIDAPTGAKYIYEAEEIKKIFTTGKGKYQMVSKWHYDKKENAIVITEIPLSTVIEDIDDKIRDLIEKGKLKEISDVHDNTGKDGLQYNIYLKRGADVDTVVQKLRKLTPFQSSVSVNMCMLKPDGVTPHVYTLKEIMDTWIDHRIECTRKELTEQNRQLEVTRNRMEGLIIVEKDLDLAIKLIRESKTEKEAMEKLISTFELNQEQASYVSTIKLININKDWITKQIKEYDSIVKKMESNNKIINSEAKIKSRIVKELEEAKVKFGQERKTEVLYDVDKNVKIDMIDDYKCHIVCTKQGYVKKLNRFSENQKVKDGDTIEKLAETSNKATLLVFTNKANMHTLKIHTLEDTVPSALGQYLPTLLGFEADEEPIAYYITDDYKDTLYFAFENGKIARVEMKSYNKAVKKMTKAFNTESNLVKTFDDSCQYVTLDSKQGKRVCFDITNINPQQSRNTKGVMVMRLKDGDAIEKCVPSNQKDDEYFIKQAGSGKKIK